MIRGAVLTLGLAAACAPLPESARHASISPEVQLSQGRLRGTVVNASDRGPSSKVEAFLGVPYAAPPVGAYRWRAPQPAPGWTGTQSAVKFAPACSQQLAPEGRLSASHEYMEQGAASEDCLYLNLWRPTKRTGAPVPVMVWVHGGGFAEGSGSVPIYDGSALARQGMIVVTLNYRLGVFGFLAHPELTKEAGTSGNYGLLDVAAALRWVRANIAAFGGDPTQVTLAGQSAGSIVVHALMASPEGQGLFDRAIAHSGSGVGPHGSIAPLQSLETAERDGLRFAGSLGVIALADLRLAPESRLLTAGAKARALGLLKSGPVIDGAVLPRSQGARPLNDVPVLAGLTLDERGASERYNSHRKEDLEAKIRGFGAQGPDAAAIYGAATDKEAASVSKRLMRDSGIAALYLWAAKHSRHSNQPTYLYLWSHVEPGPNSSIYGAFHSSDIPYVFQTLRASPERGFVERDFEISDKLASHWANYVRTGNPNTPGQAEWPAFSITNPRLMELGDTFGARPILDERRRDFFSQFVSNGGWVGPL